MNKAFTLIELLIVVAIIAILAAIAVPNFLEAQTRAKVSRVRNDLRTIATAMESYFVDNNRYPGDSDNTILEPGQDQQGLLKLTTPIAYITTLATDPFQVNEQDIDSGALYYEMGSGSDNPEPVQSWLVTSVGPNKIDETDGNDQWPGGGPTFSAVALNNYDPTNGTLSNGDIYRWGGELNTGRYFVDGELFGQIKID